MRGLKQRVHELEELFRNHFLLNLAVSQSRHDDLLVDAERIDRDLVTPGDMNIDRQPHVITRARS